MKKIKCDRCTDGIDPEIEERFAREKRGTVPYFPGNFCKKCNGTKEIEVEEN